jgi:hypothetical protein
MKILHCALDRVNIEQGLCGVFVRTGSTIDNRDVAATRLVEIVHHIRATFGEFGHNAAHDHDIEITAEHPHRVDLTFAFRLGRCLGVTNLGTRHSQDLAGCSKREECPSGWLGEVKHRPLVPQQIVQEAAALL